MGIIHRFSLLILAVLTISLAHAQDYPKISLNGVEYYVYSVEPGNTLYAISRKFSVSVSELALANPTATDGLDIGEEVLIPIKAIDKKEAKKTEVDIEGAYILHTVQKKETLFGISKKYKVPIDSIAAANPGIHDSFKIGDVIKVPNDLSAGTDESFLKPAVNDSFLVHQVIKGETLFSLSQSYAITTDSIMDMNGGLPDGLKEGQYIVIPKYTDEFVESRQAKRDSVRKASGNFTINKDTYRIGFMLPFEFELNDSTESLLKQSKDLYILTELALEFYRGAQIALDSLSKAGLNSEVFVYNVGDDIVETKETLKKAKRDSLDIIIGPMHKTSLALVSDEFKSSSTYIVSPNSFNNKVFEDNPRLIRSSAAQETMVRYLANYVAIQHQDDHVFMINTESPKDWPLRKKMISSYNDAVGTFPNTHNDSIRSLTIDKLESDKVDSWLSKDGENVLVVPSNDLAFVSDFMTRLSLLDTAYSVRVYGMDKWVKFDNIEVEYKNRFHLRLVVPSFVDYEASDVSQFLELYRGKYQIDPSSYEFGFLAFDLTFFFGSALLNYGTNFSIFFDQLEMNGVSGNYRFAKSTTGSELENKEVFIIEYKDYKVKQIN